MFHQENAVAIVPVLATNAHITDEISHIVVRKKENVDDVVKESQIFI